VKPLSPAERAECELVLADMERRGLLERPALGRLRLTAAGRERASLYAERGIDQPSTLAAGTPFPRLTPRRPVPFGAGAFSSEGGRE
jgi:hypothetical protein